jgi:hypothetical protein
MAKGSGGTRTAGPKGAQSIDGLSANAYDAQFRGHIVSMTIGDGKDKAIDIAGRKIVMMDFGDQKVPFYCSTGKGGKEDVPPGKWYPFFGFAGKWFIKASGMENYYGSERLRAAAEYLDKKFGDVRGKESFGRKVNTNNQQWFDAKNGINKEINPKNYGLWDFKGQQGPIFELLIDPIVKKLKKK